MPEIEKGGGNKGFYRNSVLLSEMKRAGVKMHNTIDSFFRGWPLK